MKSLVSSPKKISAWGFVQETEEDVEMKHEPEERGRSPTPKISSTPSPRKPSARKSELVSSAKPKSAIKAEAKPSSAVKSESKPKSAVKSEAKPKSAVKSESKPKSAVKSETK